MIASSIKYRNPTIFFIVVILLFNLFACANSKDKVYTIKEVEVQAISYSLNVEEMDPPPPEFISQFNTLSEWMENIYHSPSASKKIDTYNFSLFQRMSNKSNADTSYITSICGTNTYNIDDKTSEVRIDFSPAGNKAYFVLPQNEYKNLSYQQVQVKLRNQFLALLNEPAFKKSFLTQAQFITTDWGDTLWRK